MAITEEMIISGIISKIISDVVDIPENPIKNVIRSADKKRKEKNQSIETRIYQVILDAIKEFTKREYKGQDVLYDAAESIIRGFKNSNNNIKAVRVGLKMLVSQVTSETCEEFLKTLCHVICIDKNDILYKQITLIQGGQTFEAVQEGFNACDKNDKETHRKLDYAIESINNIDRKLDGMERYSTKRYGILIENRADEYAKRWDENGFLNDFNERDENAGINIKLKDLYLEEHLPHYKWRKNRDNSYDLRNLLNEYIANNDGKKMILILGQPGIGKSTLITWIMANLVEKKEAIFVYQFASDLDSIDWQGKNVLNDIFSIIGLKQDELEGKTLILDGFDELYIGIDRERILNKLNQDLKKLKKLKAFSMIITCRENYVYNLQNLDCDYIVLQAWDEVQIENFCRTYWGKCGNNISKDTIQKILENKEIFGIPLILYMILALDITIVKSSSMVDVYDQIFSLKRGGIYDRCYDTEHRINEPETKKYIHLISKEMAFWMFENNADEASIPQEKFKKICDTVMIEAEEKNENIQRDVLIGNYFASIKHCEGVKADELQFVHRSIYEYFVTVYFFESIHKLTSKEEVAGKLGELLKDGELSEQILEFIKYKFDSMKELNLPDITKEVFNIMLKDGMTYYTKERYRDVIWRDINVFNNMVEVVCLWNTELGEFNRNFLFYLQNSYNRKCISYLRGADLRGANLIGADLRGADLRGADLKVALLTGANLSGANLNGANLRAARLNGAYLEGAHLEGTNLIGARLRGANLTGANLVGAKLIGEKSFEENSDEVSLLSGDILEEFLYEDLNGRDSIEEKLLLVTLIGARLKKLYLMMSRLIGFVEYLT